MCVCVCARWPRNFFKAHHVLLHVRLKSGWVCLPLFSMEGTQEQMLCSCDGNNITLYQNESTGEYSTSDVTLLQTNTNNMPFDFTERI